MSDEEYVHLSLGIHKTDDRMMQAINKLLQTKWPHVASCKDPISKVPQGLVHTHTWHFVDSKPKPGCPHQ